MFEPQLPKVDNEKSINLGNGYCLVDKTGEPPSIIDSEKRTIIGLESYTFTMVADKQLFLARAWSQGRQDFSATTLPNTNILIFGNKYFERLKESLSDETVDYQKFEAESIIVAHEFTHFLFSLLSLTDVEALVEFGAQHWGIIHPFAVGLLSRREYCNDLVKRTQALRVLNPNIKIRQVIINAKSLDIAVIEVINELLAFNSAGKVIDQQRLQALVKLNPTGEEFSRERLSELAILIVDKLKKNGPIVSASGNDTDFQEKISLIINKTQRELGLYLS